MLEDLKKNYLLKGFFKKPNFLTKKEADVYLSFLRRNKTDLFLNKISLDAKKNKYHSRKIFKIYFYLLYCLEKEGASNLFLKNFVYKKLSSFMFIFNDYFVDKEIYLFLKKEKVSFNEKLRPLELTKELYELLVFYEKLNEVISDYFYFKEFQDQGKADSLKETKFKKDIQKKTDKLISLLSFQIKNKKISKKASYDILELLEYHNHLAFFDNLDDFLKNKINSKKLF